MFLPLEINWANLHQLLRTLQETMVVECAGLIGVAKGVAGIGALFFVAYRVWRSLASAEPIDVFPLLRPFAIGLCIMFFPNVVIGGIDGILKPVNRATSALMENKTFDLEHYREVRDKLEKEAMLRNPETAYLISNEKFDEKLEQLGWGPKDLITMAGMYIHRETYKLGQKIRQWFANLLEILFHAASLAIDTVRSFFLIVLAILGPIAFAISVYDGFHNTLTA